MSPTDDLPPGVARQDDEQKGTLWTHGLPFAVAVEVWGYDVAGDASEPVACLAERPEDGPWDRGLTYLGSIERWHGAVRMPVPWWWALWAAPDLITEGRVA